MGKLHWYICKQDVINFIRPSPLQINNFYQFLAINCEKVEVNKFGVKILLPAFRNIICIILLTYNTNILHIN
jgi:hypothetical protein